VQTLDDLVPTTAYSLSRDVIKGAQASHRPIPLRALLSRLGEVVSARRTEDQLGAKANFW
jgi:hypothetical protein